MQSNPSFGTPVESLLLHHSPLAATSLISDPLPCLPLMATTRLQLDLLINNSVIDLKNVTEVILADPGATIQILRMAGDEFPDPDERPRRIEDCIVSLSLARCYQVLCESEVSHSGPHVAEWQRCRRLAECTRELAKELEGFCPEEAYLVGLLCRIGRFPQLLGWKGGAFLSAESNALGVMLACHWQLPQYVLSAIREQHKLDAPSSWSNVLALAHRLADQCPA